MPDVRWCELDGSRMPWIEFGPADGVPVLIVPGLTDGLGPVSEPAVAASIPSPPPAWRDVRVLVVSHRHPMHRGITTRQLAADLATFIDRMLETPPALIAAHSMGAMITMHLAVDRPDLTRRLVLSAPAARPDEDFDRQVRQWADLVRAEDWEGFARAACTAAYTGEEQARQLAALGVIGPPEGTHLAQRHLALTDAALGHDATDSLPDLTAPTLLLGGTSDPVVTPDAVAHVAGLVPHAEVAWFEEMAHGFPEQDRAGYQTALQEFLADTPVAARQ